jgi:4a-hydroxytetrahydrobiopterin dehydratase
MAAGTDMRWFTLGRGVHVDKPASLTGAGRPHHFRPRRAFDPPRHSRHGRTMSKPLSAEEIAAATTALPGWSFERDALAKTFTFGSFREAMSFLGRVAFEAEELNHHPEWTNVYNRVAVRLNTHDAGGKVTQKDVELARRMQKISWVG